MRQVFLQTVTSLQNRQLTAADVASRVRLSKTPETYAATRSTLREQRYEALLAAQRSSWTPGERIRIYRSQSCSTVWLPDEQDAHLRQTWRSAGGQD